MTPPRRLPTAVLFDWDNTLIDNWECIRTALNAALVRFGRSPWTMAETLSRVRHSMRDSFPILFGEHWTEARDIFYGAYAESHLRHVRALPAAERLLEALAGRGVYCAVVSNKTGRFLRAEVAALGWDRWFGQLVGAADAEADKPATAPVRMALAPASLCLGEFDRETVWFVGDADIDLECAHAAGCLPILLGPADGPGVARFPPACRFADCAELLALVRALGDTISEPTFTAMAKEGHEPGPATA